MNSVSKMASKDVRGSDHEGIISLLENVLSSESNETDSDSDEILDDDNFSESDVSETNTSASESDDERSDSVGPSQQNRVRKEKLTGCGEILKIIPQFTMSVQIAGFVNSYLQNMQLIPSLIFNCF
jgi:hypothetical protein